MAQLLNGLAFGSLLLVLSSGLVLIFGLRDVINFAHGAVYMLGAYVALTVAQTTNFWVALVVAPVVLAIFGAAVDRWGLQNLAHQVHIVPILALYGLALLIDDFVVFTWGRGTQSLTPPPGLNGAVSVFGANYPTYRLFVIVAGLVLGLGLLVWLRTSAIGLHVRAASQDEEVTAMMGVNVDRASTIVVALGFGMAGLAGVLVGPFQAIQPGMAAAILVLTFIVVVVGGLGSIGGAMIAALLIGVVQVTGAVFLPAIATFSPYLLMILILIVRPTGIAGTRV